MPKFLVHNEIAVLVTEVGIVEAETGARRKSDREAARLRSDTIQATRLKCAALIRAFKSREDLAVEAVLERIEELRPDMDHVMELFGAWELASRGLVKIEIVTTMTANSIPPPTRHAITLTSRGKAMLSRWRISRGRKG